MTTLTVFYFYTLEGFIVSLITVVPFIVFYIAPAYVVLVALALVAETIIYRRW